MLGACSLLTPVKKSHADRREKGTNHAKSNDTTSSTWEGKSDSRAVRQSFGLGATHLVRDRGFGAQEGDAGWLRSSLGLSVGQRRR